MPFDESKHPRDGDGRFTDGKSDFDRAAEKYFPHLTENGKSDTIKTPNENGELATPYPEKILPPNVRDLLRRLRGDGDIISVSKPLSFEDISILSRQTGVEFASLTVGKAHYVIRGSSTGTTFPLPFFQRMKEMHAELHCHSHPYVGDIRPSGSDLALASIMSWQKEFRIISPDGKMCAYTKDGVVNTESISSERKYDEEEYRKIFGGSDSDQ